MSPTANQITAWLLKGLGGCVRMLELHEADCPRFDQQQVNELDDYLHTLRIVCMGMASKTKERR